MSRTYQDAIALVALLCERFLRCFFLFQKRRKPLKIGIDRDLADILGDAVDRKTLALALRLYVSNFHYRSAQKAGTPRFDLDGNEDGAVSEKDALSAAAYLAAAFKARQQANKPKAITASAPPAPPAPPKKDGLASLREAAARRKTSMAGDQGIAHAADRSERQAANSFLRRAEP